MCANLADPAPASIARGGDPASAGHGPRCVTRGHSRVAVATPSLSAGHGPPPVARGGGATPVAAPIAALGLSTEHRPRRAARGRGPAAVAGLRWTWVFGFNFQLVIQNTLVSITIKAHTLEYLFLMKWNSQN